MRQPTESEVEAIVRSALNRLKDAAWKQRNDLRDYPAANPDLAGQQRAHDRAQRGTP